MKFLQGKVSEQRLFGKILNFIPKQKKVTCNTTNL